MLDKLLRVLPTPDMVLSSLCSSDDCLLRNCGRCKESRYGSMREVRLTTGVKSVHASAIVACVAHVVAVRGQTCG